MARSNAPPNPIRIGIAGWSIARQHAARVPGAGTHLQRCAQHLGAAEINSSFYRPHQPRTYARWAEAVPPDFRFSVKLPKEITHTRRLVGASAPLRAFLGEVAGLGEKLGPVLIQLPPSLAFEPAAEKFFELIRRRFDGALVCEPRHRSWFTQRAGRALRRARIARVAADPALVPAAAQPGGWDGLRYYRLHGSPRMYWSAYLMRYLARLARQLRRDAAEAPTWCIFDNTGLGHALANALALQERLGLGSGCRPL
ncbi:MAG TPA: DUF72 domain-containing protein [Solimonas sp.]|nr:DUF72 domain-containing protein [Solimonas sp.]